MEIRDMTGYQQTFGPVVIEWDDEPGKLVAKCQSGRFDCKGRINNVCVWNKGEDGKGRHLPSDMKTPDWCQYKASALDDAEGMRG
jgi:hypothetical protein